MNFDHPKRSIRSRRRRARLALAIVLCCGGAPVNAHDFWVQPSAFWLSPTAITTMTLQVGHGPARQRSPITLRRIIRYEAFAPDGSRADLKERLQLGALSADGSFVFQKPGAHVIVFQTDDRAQVHLPFIRFNDYIKAEGLTPAIDLRVRLNRMDRDGSENYSRCAKSIVQVGGAVAGNQSQATRILGLPLEIVPDRSPYALPRSITLPVRVLYLGRPLAGALVKLTRLEDDAVPFEMHRTDRAGRATFAMPSGGTWLLNVIWTRVQPSSAETDFDTTFSSLSFGFSPNRAVRTP
jgi:uncharacterized GH25 family protein